MKTTGLAALLAVSLTAGCASHNISQPSAPIQSVISAPLEADIELGQDISGDSNATILFGIFLLGQDNKYADGITYTTGQSTVDRGFFGGVLGQAIDGTKAAAAYKAVTASGADVIVAPRYVIDTQDYVILKQVSVSVKGKAGKIQNIRNAK
ncbi:MAG: hypothetical protein IPM37_16530 [Hahellaceae bacterium]|nr:hypothetical protein [Hahellaceae bacterium]